MIALPDLLMFVAALVAVYLLPGPDMALMISSSAFNGARSGLLTAVGLAIARTVHVILSAVGLAALLHAHPALFDGVRWLGAAYLLLLAWKLLRTSASSDAAQGHQTGRGWAAIRSGIMTNLLNPKALMFCAFLLPQFITAQHNLTTQYLTLGAILVGLGFAFDLVYALAAARLAQRLAGSGTIQTACRLLLAGIFGAAAIRLGLQ